MGQVIFTKVFRASHVHLAQPHSFQQGDEPRYSVEALFPKDGTGSIAATGISFPSDVQDIVDAVWQESQAAFGVGVNLYDPSTATMAGVQMPPVLKDGDQKLAKDVNGNPVPGQADPVTAGKFRLSLKSKDPVGTAGPNGQDIAASSIYSGAWVRAQVEVSAYKNANGSSIISIQLMNVQMCYEDESLGGKAPRQAATAAFAGMNVENSNVAAGFGQQGAMGNAPAPTQGVPQPQQSAPMQPQQSAPMQPQQSAPMQPQHRCSLSSQHQCSLSSQHQCSLSSQRLRIIWTLLNSNLNQYTVRFRLHRFYTE
ncbi:hypothetical protein SIPHO055v2_p0027 [Vibrio phage 104E43.1]|nr:hypothetical protein SIPHO055v2_p0027 [Vibrio phage 104E43.1]